VGTVTVELTATDGSGETPTATFDITVENVNDAPTVEGAIGNQTTDEDQPFSLTFDTDLFADVDADDALTYTAQLQGGGALPAWLTFNAETRTFSGTPENGDVGTYHVELIATDGADAAATVAFDITVENVNDAPTLANPILDQTATEDEAFSFAFDAGTFADIDAGDELAYTATFNGSATPPAWLAFDAATRTFSGTPANGDVGTVTVELTATDGSGETATATFDITVENVNDAPVVEDQEFHIKTGSPAGTVVDTVAAADVDANDTLAYTITAGNDDGLFAIDSASGQITIAPGQTAPENGEETFT
jgi:hypothetical protein